MSLPFTIFTDDFQLAMKVLEKALKDVPEDGFIFLSAMGFYGMPPIAPAPLCNTVDTSLIPPQTNDFRGFIQFYPAVYSLL